MPVPPETAKNYELGFKSSLLDRRVYFNATLFRADYRGFQTSVTSFLPDGTFLTFLNSIGHLRTQGLELDAVARITSNFRLNGAFAYTDATGDRIPPNGTATAGLKPDGWVAPAFVGGAGTCTGHRPCRSPRRPRRTCRNTRWVVAAPGVVLAKIARSKLGLIFGRPTCAPPVRPSLTVVGRRCSAGVRRIVLAGALGQIAGQLQHRAAIQESCPGRSWRGGGRENTEPAVARRGQAELLGTDLAWK